MSNQSDNLFPAQARHLTLDINSPPLDNLAPQHGAQHSRLRQSIWRWCLSYSSYSTCSSPRLVPTNPDISQGQASVAQAGFSCPIPEIYSFPSLTSRPQLPKHQTRGLLLGPWKEDLFRILLQADSQHQVPAASLPNTLAALAYDQRFPVDTSPLLLSSPVKSKRSIPTSGTTFLPSASFSQSAFISALYRCHTPLYLVFSYQGVFSIPVFPYHPAYFKQRAQFIWLFSLWSLCIWRQRPAPLSICPLTLWLQLSICLLLRMLQPTSLLRGPLQSWTKCPQVWKLICPLFSQLFHRCHRLAK